jgi:3-phosphoshikimate 1-carboxyvinyltransferase
MKLLPDILAIEPLAKSPNCTVTVPGSKSITNRALILAVLSSGKCTLRGALWADDTQVMVESLRRLGFAVKVSPDPAEPANRTIEVEGCGGEIPSDRAELYVGNAGTAARFLTALVTLGQGEYRLTGDPRMHERPMEDLFEPLRQLGIEVVSPNGRLPVTIRARGLRGGRVSVSARHSSQFASALMLIAPYAKLDVQLAEPDEPHGYVDMTRTMVESFTAEYAVEPDLSSASYFVAAGWLTGGDVRVAGWPRAERGKPEESLQVDGKFPKFLPPPARLSRRDDLGDSVMTSVICALFGKQPMTLTDAARMREQECDRIHAMVTELQRVGAKVEEHEDGLTVWPVTTATGTVAPPLHGADIETYKDHRMAMSFAVLGLKVPGIRLKNPACVSKTFPNFFDKLERLRR